MYLALVILMLVRGNAKLGKDIWCFSIPAQQTCPGRTELCDSRCYAQKGLFVMPTVMNSHQNNLKATRRADFDLKMTTELLTNKVTICRIHVAGDFYSPEYIKKWIAIVKANPTVKFFAYTRSWRLSEMRPLLEEFSKLPNMRMWWSLDRETGHPIEVPDRIGLAYMAVTPHDVPEYPFDLMFRDYALRDSVLKKVNGAMVCPPENGVNKNMHCQQCGFCWRNDLRINPMRKQPQRTRKRRIALQLVA